MLNLWTAIVAQRLGFNEEECLSLAKALAGLNAQSKGRRLGIFKPHEDKPQKVRKQKQGETIWIELLGRPVPAKSTEDGTRALNRSDVV